MTKVTLSKKDIEMIETIKLLKVMTSSQIQRLFFNHKSNQCRRCRQLVDAKKLKSFREGFGKPTIYYYKRKPTQQLTSMLIISEVYLLLHEMGYNIKEFQREYVVEVTDKFTIRPDAYFIVVKDEIEFEFFVELDRTKELSSDKYYKAMKLGYYSPPIISISNRRRQIYDGMDVLKVKLDLSNFREIITSYL